MIVRLDDMDVETTMVTEKTIKNQDNTDTLSIMFNIIHYTNEILDTLNNKTGVFSSVVAIREYDGLKEAIDLSKYNSLFKVERKISDEMNAIQVMLIESKN